MALCAAITAAFAGVAGAWSPCGFSMVETIGTAMGDRRRAATRAASVTFTLGALAGGVVTFGGLSLLGSAIDGGGDVREAIGAALALAAAIADWRGVRIAPQIRRQVPESWRRRQPLALACGLYGVLLGLGFTTFVLAFAVWALAGISFAAGDPTIGLLVGIGFGLGRAAPVLLMAPSFAGSGARRLDSLAREPRMWLGLRRLDALGLGLCALFLSGASAGAAVLPAAYDPSTAGGQLAWQPLAGAALLRTSSGQTLTLPGGDPALGGARIAWQSNGAITVADAHTLTPLATVAAANVTALATSEEWLIYRDEGPRGEESLIGVSLLGPARRRYIAGARLEGEIGRPTLNGAEVAFTENTSHASRLLIVNLAHGKRRTLRSASRNASLLNPSLLGGRLLYERVDRCAQQLRLGLVSGAHERVLLSLPSTATRDPGYQPGFTHAYNSASLCHNRGVGQGSRVRLGPTALGPRVAYVTELATAGRNARILTLPR